MKYSVNQENIFEHIKTKQSSLVINATAGSGKTTTIIKCVEYIPPGNKVLFCAFNSIIAKELSVKLPSYVTTLTLNAMGHRTYVNGNKVDDVKLSKSKLITIIKDSPDIKKMTTRLILGTLRFRIKSLVDIARANGIGVCMEDSYSNWVKLAEHNDIIFTLPDKVKMEQSDIDKLAIKIARKLLNISVNQTGIIDFNDQLYMPLVYNSAFVKYNFVFVDEAQDLSCVQRKMLLASLLPNGRLIAVGDKFQSIYGFRAAEVDSLAQIVNEFNCDELPLDTSYRCPRSIVKLANEFSPNMKYSEHATEGKVIETKNSYDMYPLDDFKNGDLVLCRNNKPLIKLAFYLMDNERQVTIKGDDMKTLISNTINKFDCFTVERMMLSVEQWKNKTILDIRKKDPYQSVAWVSDMADITIEFIDLSGCETIPEVKTFMSDFFTTSTTGSDKVVTLSTIHKSKGIEADNVHILDYNLIPSKFATTKWMIEQEYNLAFVAITRTLKVLRFIKSPSDND